MGTAVNALRQSGLDEAAEQQQQQAAGGGATAR